MTILEDPPSQRSTRFVGEIIRLHERLNFRGLIDALPDDDSVYRAAYGPDMVTVAAWTEEIPHRYLCALAGFRLTQYLQIGYASAAVTAAESLYREPLANIHPGDLHCITISRSSGKLLGYVTMAHNGDTGPRSVRDGARGRYPCERAHRIDIFDRVDAPADLMTDQVREVKRFVHARTLLDRAARLRVSLELLRALAWSVGRHRPVLRALVGDVEPHGALRHLILMGLRVKVVGGTAPSLPDTDLMHPMYLVRNVVEPFYADLPHPDVLDRYAARLRDVVASPNPFGSLSELLPTLQGSVERIGDAA
jgi:hypothetical protein